MHRPGEGFAEQPLGLVGRAAPQGDVGDGDGRPHGRRLVAGRLGDGQRRLGVGSRRRELAQLAVDRGPGQQQAHPGR